ncbi:MAG TPA: FecR family protein [Rectinemataceae bacterium]|nr:FecR family protein [Rectinemataceae bacterium]
MKRLFMGMVLAASALAAWALQSVELGRIDYVEGTVTISRVGRIISNPNIDDPLLSGDLIRTGGDGQVVIAMDKATGMRGTITVDPRSTLYLKLDFMKGQSRTTVDFLTGSMRSKVTKIAGEPRVNVVTDSATMGVRGTEYGVAVSVNDDVLVTCTRGEVAVTDGTNEVPVPAGHGVVKKPDQGFEEIPVAISSVKDFTQLWMTEEIDAFKADAPRALADYAERYRNLEAQFAEAYKPFQESPTPRKWAEEDQSGAKIDPMSPEVLREKKEMAGYLFSIRKVLFIFERVYYRVDQISAIVAGTDAEKALVAPGLTAGAFIASVKADRDKLAAEVARYRYIASLFAERDAGGGFFGNQDDFFSSSDGF